MESTKIILDDGSQIDVKGIFYIFNSRYYFIYTLGEKVDDDYVQLYVSQVCKEITNTPNGPVDTGYMLGIETTDTDDWSKVQESITKIVDEKKNSKTDTSIQYLPISMLVNLKIVSKNKFKLMTSLFKEIFNIDIANENSAIPNQNSVQELYTDSNGQMPYQDQAEQTQSNNANEDNDVIIDYRAKFFEEQDKNKMLENQVKELQQKLSTIKDIL